MLKFFKKTIINMKIRNKLILSFILIFFCLTIIYTLFIYNTVAWLVETNVIDSTRNLLNQISREIERLESELTDTLDFFMVNSSTQKILTRSYESYPLGQQLDDAAVLESLIKNLEKSSDIIKVRLYVNDKFIYSREDISLFSFPPLSQTEYIKKVSDANGKIVWNIPNIAEKENNILTAGRAIKSYLNIQNSIGMVTADVPKNSFMDIVKNASYLGSKAILFTNDGRVVADYGGLQDVDTKMLFERIEQSNGISHIDNSIMLNIKLKNSQWHLISLIDKDTIFQEVNRIQARYYLVGIIVICVLIILIILLSELHTRRIKRLAFSMTVSKDEPSLQLLPWQHSRDEIGVLEVAFRTYQNEIVKLLKRKYELGKKVEKAQYETLLAQINPHFLYNAFDLINLISIKYEVPEISKIIQSLSKFYKLSLNHGKNEIQLCDEIAHIGAYIDFQNYRYQYDVKLDIQADDDVMKMYVIHFILQPLVENSFLHGLQQIDEKEGTIFIKAYIENKSLIVSVEDSGVGGDLERLENILNGTTPENGYGIKNVNERIHLSYSKDYGLSYSHSEYGGLKATIRLPICTTQTSRQNDNGVK